MDYSQIALSFRAAFDNTNLANAPGFLSKFPKGCCGWAAIFMGNYLKLVHGKSPLHVWAKQPSKSCNHEWPEVSGHEWIEVDGIILDITLDQFGDGFPKDYAGETLPLHKELKINMKKKPQALDEICHGDQSAIVDLYRQIASYVDQEIAG